MSSSSLVAPGQAAAQRERTVLELMSHLDIYSDPISVRKTGIICTIGPACRNVDTLRQLIKAGMCIARLNFSHGTHEFHAGSIAMVREAAAAEGVPVAIALDTKGPEIRTGRVRGYDPKKLIEFELVKDETIVVTSNEAFKDACDNKTVYIDYPNMAKVLHPGQFIYMADGIINLKVTKILSESPGAVECVICNNAKLGSQKGVNLPGARVDLPAISEQDSRDLLFAVEQELDMVFASFIRKRQDITDIRTYLTDNGGKGMYIIAKIENHEGVQNFDHILEETDGVMVARGDLGIEIPSEKVFLAQKMMIAKCNRAGKPVICATQMLESMISAPRPTRAEGTDVANAVLDGSDCVMLSGETAKGEYPIETVQVMARICLEAEGAVFYRQFREELRLLTPLPMSPPEACCVAAVEISQFIGAGAIVCLSISGTTARLLAKWRPMCPVLSVTRTPHVARVMRLHRGVHTLLYSDTKKDESSWLGDVDARAYWAMERGKEMGMLKTGASVVVVHGWQTGPGYTNTVRVLAVP